ncbi:MAG: thioesterase family protein, partial [Acidobacteriota bacterium]
MDSPSRDDELLTPKIVAAVHKAFEQDIPFNRVLGLKVDSLALERSVLSFETRPEHIGNFARGILHGGVISAVL